MKNLFKQKASGFYLCAAASVLALVMAVIVFITLDSTLPNTVSGGAVIGVVLLAGVALQIAVTFLPISFAGVLSVIVYSVAFGITLNKIPNTVADHFNQVNYTGGDYGMCLFYAISMLAIVLICVVACFFNPTKNEKNIL